MNKKQATYELIRNCNNEIGYKEKGVNLNKYAENLDKYDTFYIPINGYAWCAVFAIDMFVETFGYELAKKLISFDNHSCSCSWWSRNMVEVDLSEAERGDIWMNDDKSHCGIVDSIAEDGTILLIAGNTNDMVRSMKATSGHIYRPMWGEIEDFKSETETALDYAVEHEIFRGDGNGNFWWKDNITREEAAIVAYRIMKQIEEML